MIKKKIFIIKNLFNNNKMKLKLILKKLRMFFVKKKRYKLYNNKNYKNIF